MATFPPESRSPMIPEPTTAARSKAVPTPSPTARWTNAAAFGGTALTGRPQAHGS